MNTTLADPFPATLQALGGTTPQQFTDLCRRLEPIWPAQRRLRLNAAADRDPPPEPAALPAPGSSRCRLPPGC